MKFLKSVTNTCAINGVALVFASLSKSFWHAESYFISNPSTDLGVVTQTRETRWTDRHLPTHPPPRPSKKIRRVIKDRFSEKIKIQIILRRCFLACLITLQCDYFILHLPFGTYRHSTIHVSMKHENAIRYEYMYSVLKFEKGVWAFLRRMKY